MHYRWKLVMVSIHFRGKLHTKFVKMMHVVTSKEERPIVDDEWLKSWLKEIGIREGETFSMG